MSVMDERWRAREAATCVHFNGAHNTNCDAGVCYCDLAELGEDLRLPCLPPVSARLAARLPADCTHLRLPTEAEVREKEARLNTAVDDLVAKLARGECPTCGKAAGRRQVGRCAYCRGCGARIGQVA